MKHITIATRSSTPKLRFALLLSLSLCALSQRSAWSQETNPSIALGHCGIFRHCPPPESQIEPNAGKWKTWLLDDVRQVRPLAPPPRSISEQEIGVLKRLSSDRDAAALDLINYWDAGS